MQACCLCPVVRGQINPDVVFRIKYYLLSVVKNGGVISTHTGFCRCCQFCPVVGCRSSANHIDEIQCLNRHVLAWLNCSNSYACLRIKCRQSEAARALDSICAADLRVIHLARRNNNPTFVMYLCIDYRYHLERTSKLRHSINSMRGLERVDAFTIMTYLAGE